mmetsp:Transcript_11390/g.23563  ORF Transcript_11390/g.23563 Transcript_11390/m.23563 type:complete len:80 (+) Transcript_11390:350-589(+)
MWEHDGRPIDTHHPCLLTTIHRRFRPRDPSPRGKNKYLNTGWVDRGDARSGGFAANNQERIHKHSEHWKAIAASTNNES